MDAIVAFVRNIIHTQYKDIPVSAVEAEKKQLLDTLGVALAGSSKPGVEELINIVKIWGGNKQSTIINHGIKAPAPMAAQVNATMAHALDYDDGHRNALVHTGSVVVPTGLAIAEKLGKVNGKEFIMATALATDLMCRLGLATRPQGTVVNCGWHLTSLYGFFGAVTAAGKLLNLNEEKMINAFGIAYHQASGNMQCIEDGALTKRMGPGFAAKGGIIAALMAEKGITGAKNCLEGKFGLFNLYHQGDYDQKKLVDNLGKEYEGINVGMKPYPCCGHTHSFIDLALALVSEHNIKSSHIKEITVFGGEAARVLCMPLEIKRNPRNYVDAQFSIPWAIAVAIARGKPSMEHFTDTAIKSEDIAAIASKINFEFKVELTKHGATEPGIIDILTRSGKVYSKRIDYPLGSIENPLSFNDCVLKFFDCASYSVKHISRRKLQRVVDLIAELENLDNVTEIMQLVSRKQS